MYTCIVHTQRIYLYAIYSQELILLRSPRRCVKCTGPSAFTHKHTSTSELDLNRLDIEPKTPNVHSHFSDRAENWSSIFIWLANGQTVLFFCWPTHNNRIGISVNVMYFVSNMTRLSIAPCPAVDASASLGMCKGLIVLQSCCYCVEWRNSGRRHRGFDSVGSIWRVFQYVLCTHTHHNTCITLALCRHVTWVATHTHIHTHSRVDRSVHTKLSLNNDNFAIHVFANWKYLIY